MTSRMYCAVFGCLNSSMSHPDMALFRLPGNSERRLEWLQRIGREDLENKPKYTSYRVCEKHFDANCILYSAHRKILRKNSVPSLLLPSSARTSQTEDKLTQTVSSLTEDGTQTENTANLAQTATTLFSYSPRKTKLKVELSQCRKKIKLLESENKTQKSDEDTFHRLCDTFLTDEQALLIKAQSKPRQQGKGHRYDKDYIIYCLNLYCISPQAYRFMQSAFCLPYPSTLYNLSFPITTETNERAMSVLKFKVAQMKEAEKICSVMIDNISLKANLFYNIKKDKITGFHEIEGLQSPEPAKNALVIMVRGIFVNWKQPISYAFISESRNYDEINKWIDNVLHKLFEIGLNIRVFVSRQGYDLWKVAKQRSISTKRPYFLINNRKVYYIFDAPHLIKDVRNNLMQYDIHFGSCIAKYDHILKFYNHDIKNSFRLEPKLNNSHITPTSFEKMKVCYATQLLSKSVANSIRTYVDNDEIEKSGRDTANFLMIMSNLLDSLNASHLRNSNEYKIAYEGNETQKAFFKQSIRFFKDLKLRNPKDGSDVTSSVRFIDGFQITIKSIMLLFDELQLEGYNLLKTRKCNLDALKNLFGPIRTKNGTVLNPTCRQFASMFKNLFFTNIIKPQKAGNCADDFGSLLVQTLNEKVTSNTNYEEFSSIKISSSDYNQLDMPEKNALFYICSYILKRCLEHDTCDALKLYVKPDQRSQEFSSDSRYSRYRVYSKANLLTLLFVPSDDFLEYIENMDQIFRNSFKTRNIGCKVAVGIYGQVKDVPFTPPCTCFPKQFVLKLYIRMRIFFTLKYNNKAFRTSLSRRKCFSVTNL